jgi:DNA topoisomerase-3
VARQTFEMLAGGHQSHLAPHARKALQDGYVRPSKRIFDNSKVSDHFAIIPTLQAPGSLSEAERKLYDLVVRRFMAVFYPSAEYQVTTRITTAHHEGTDYKFQSNGKVLVKPGWLAIYGKEADDEVEKKEGESSKSLVAVRPVKWCSTSPPRSRRCRRAARPLQRSHAAGRHGRRGQDHRRR